MDQSTSLPQRRTQKDRRESTQRGVLEATLRCIGRVGYASVSLNEVAKDAGVSRGAITHHYASKLELAAAAMEHFFTARYERLMSLLADKSTLSLDERLDILGKEFEDLFPIGFEIIVALRTDPELQARYDALAMDRYEEMTQGYERMFPEFAKAQSPRLLIAVVAAFYRGLFIEGFSSDRERLAQMAELFKAMLRTYVAKGLSPDRKSG
ncbi:MAG TPA: TetR/AcrR family transcriptional regulator [Verrucomicrobiae bacterium]|jgi:AcrR family transcriptional regulator|nr:TetR/AcrR family transcriptional regulator [Verrucomicrobiae bacterium]